MRFVTVLCLFLVGACPAQAGERIIEVVSGRELSVDQLLQQVRASDIVLLGERHDNARHHYLRGELLKELPQAVVVAEQLQSPVQVRYGPDLLLALVTAGFDPVGWRWPLYQPLFSSLVEKNIPLFGGNLSRSHVRKIVREGFSALSPEVIEMFKEAPLSSAANAVLDEDLKQGHCNYVPLDRLAGLRLAQRARDQAMFETLRRQNGRPVVLLAGNGHVRGDYGIPVLLRHFLPEKRWLNIGFVEEGEGVSQQMSANLYSHLWVTKAAHREDDCRQLEGRFNATLPATP